MYENIRTQITAGLISVFDSSTTQEVLKIIDRVMVDYDITRKETALIVRDNTLVENIKLYVLCMKAKGVSEGATKNNWYTLRKFAASIGKPIGEITTSDIRGYLLRYQMVNGTKNSSLDKIRSAISRFFEWCVEEEIVTRNPCKKIPKIIAEEPNRHALTEEQLEYCRMSCRNKRDTALLEVFYSTGARISEIARLNQDDIDWYDGSITVLGKGKKYYTVYLNAKSRVALKSYLNSRGDNNPALFVTARGAKRLSKDSIRRFIEAIGKRADIKDVVCPHVLRHTMATTAFRNGASLEVVQHMLNHASPATTQIYAEMDRSKVASEHKRTVI